MDLDLDWEPVRRFLAHMPLTMDAHEVFSFRDVDTSEDPGLARAFEQRRWEAILKSAFLELAHAAGDKPISVELIFDPVASPHRPIYGPIYGPARD